MAPHSRYDIMIDRILANYLQENINYISDDNGIHPLRAIELMHSFNEQECLDLRSAALVRFEKLKESSSKLNPQIRTWDLSKI